MQTNCLQLKSICSFLASLKTAANSSSLLFPPPWMIWHNMLPDGGYAAETGDDSLCAPLRRSACFHPVPQPAGSQHFRILYLHGETGCDRAHTCFLQPGRPLDQAHGGVAPQMHTAATQRLMCRRGADNREEGQGDCCHQSHSQSKTGGTTAGAASD